MRCLMCQKKFSEGTWQDIFLQDDPLCYECRSKWERKKIRFKFEGVPVRSSYVYNEAFSSCLIQYKECYDEALKDIFLYEVKNQLKRMYPGYTFLLMPSSQTKEKERGFSHLEKIFEDTNIPTLQPFIKDVDVAQKGLTKEERLNMSKHIYLKEDVSLPKKIVLFDDTITTGATISGALSCLDKDRHKIRIYTLSANAAWLK